MGSLLTINDARNAPVGLSGASSRLAWNLMMANQGFVTDPRVVSQMTPAQRAEQATLFAQQSALVQAGSPTVLVKDVAAPQVTSAQQAILKAAGLPTTITPYVQSSPKTASAAAPEPSADDLRAKIAARLAQLRGDCEGQGGVYGDPDSANPAGTCTLQRSTAPAPDMPISGGGNPTPGSPYYEAPVVPDYAPSSGEQPIDYVGEEGPAYDEVGFEEYGGESADDGAAYDESADDVDTSGDDEMSGFNVDQATLRSMTGMGADEVSFEEGQNSLINLAASFAPKASNTVSAEDGRDDLIKLAATQAKIQQERDAAASSFKAKDALDFAGGILNSPAAGIATAFGLSKLQPKQRQAAPPPPTEQPRQKQGWSTGAKVAVGVGVAVGLVVLFKAFGGRKAAPAA